jgi:hypothetical protein
MRNIADKKFENKIVYSTPKEEGQEGGKAERPYKPYNKKENGHYNREKHGDGEGDTGNSYRYKKREPSVEVDSDGFEIKKTTTEKQEGGHGYSHGHGHGYRPRGNRKPYSGKPGEKRTFNKRNFDNKEKENEGDNHPEERTEHKPATEATVTIKSNAKNLKDLFA